MQSIAQIYQKSLRRPLIISSVRVVALPGSPSSPAHTINEPPLLHSAQRLVKHGRIILPANINLLLNIIQSNPINPAFQEAQNNLSPRLNSA